MLTCSFLQRGMLNSCQANRPRLEQTQSSVELVPHVSLSPTAQLPMMNAGPFTAVMKLCMHEMQHGAFRTQAASQTGDISDQEDSDDGDELAKLKVEMGIANKAA